MSRKGAEGPIVFIYSKERVTQGDPLSMLGYGIGVLPLICQQKKEFPLVKQPRYADGIGTGGAVSLIYESFLNGYRKLGQLIWLLS